MPDDLNSIALLAAGYVLGLAALAVAIHFSRTLAAIFAIGLVLAPAIGALIRIAR